MAYDIDKIDSEAIGMLRNAHMKQVQLTVLADQKKHVAGYYRCSPQCNRLKYGDE